MGASSSNREQLENTIMRVLVAHPEKMPLVNLKPDDLIHSGNRHIFKVMIDLMMKGVRWDFVTIYHSISQEWRSHLNQITAICDYLSHMLSQYLKLYRTYQTKELVQTLMQHGLHDNPIEFAQRIQQKTIELSDQNTVSLKEITLELMSKLEKASKEPKKLTGVASGIQSIDLITWGFQPQRLYILAARPSMGKSALAHNMAYNISQTGQRVYLQSLEGSAQQIMCRMLAKASGISNELLNRGQLRPTDWPRIIKKLNELSKYNLIIDDSPGLPSSEIVRRIRKHHADRLINLVIVDHLQEIYDEAQNRHLAISKALSNLRAVAMDIKIPMIVLCQLNRSVEHGSDKKPTMAHLKESGDIEALADVVMLLYREGYYNKKIQGPQLAELTFAKNRDGRTGYVTLLWNPDVMTFSSTENVY